MKITFLIWKGNFIFISDPTLILMAHEKVASGIESTKMSIQGTKINTALLSYAMIGEYTLEPLFYGVHNRGVQLVELVEYPLAKYVEKYISHRTGLINL